MDQPPTTGAPGEGARDGALWQRLFEGRSPRAVLGRLQDGDPLALADRCEAFIRSRALLLDSTRLYLRVVARVAYAARGYRGDPPLAVWLEERVVQSAAELAEQDESEVARGLPPEEPLDPPTAELAEALGAEPALARAICVTFNRLPFDHRRAFTDVVMGGEPVEAFAARVDLSPDTARKLLHEALATLAQLGQAGFPDPLGGAG